MALRRRKIRKAVVSQRVIAGIDVELTRKSMKYLRLKVSPPDGRVRLSAPHRASQIEIEAMVMERLDWIRAQQDALRASLPTPSELIAGECVPLWGEEKTLALEFGNSPRKVTSQGEHLHLRVRVGDTAQQRLAVLEDFYRAQLKDRLTAAANTWQPVVGREAHFWGIKKMRTRWGSCNISRKRIWVNLELAKLPLRCLDYVVVHELIHLYEARHNTRFYQLMQAYMPDWKAWHDFLKQAHV